MPALVTLCAFRVEDCALKRCRSSPSRHSAAVDCIDTPQCKFADAAPGLPEGVLQVNVVIPAGVRSGSVPVFVKIGDAVSNTATVVGQ